MTSNDTTRTAADLPAGTCVTTPGGRLGTVNGYDIGRVTNPDHPNYGREYVGVDLDPVEGDMGCGRRSRSFVDELRIEEDQPKRKNLDLRSSCSVHRIADKRGGRSIDLAVPACEPGTTYGAWSDGAGGFIYTTDCAIEVANYAADELRQLAKENDTDTIQILAVCCDHEEQPADGCEDCYAENA